MGQIGCKPSWGLPSQCSDEGEKDIGAWSCLTASWGLPISILVVERRPRPSEYEPGTVQQSLILKTHAGTVNHGTYITWDATKRTA